MVSWSYLSRKRRIRRIILQGELKRIDRRLVSDEKKQEIGKYGQGLRVQTMRGP